MEKKIFEFRCLKCNALFCKCSIESMIEVKCKKCKWFFLFKNGETFDSSKNFNLI